MVKSMRTIISYEQILRAQVPRLVEGLNYSERMKRAGVPDKVRRKILRRWTSPFVYFVSQEMRGLVSDMARRVA